MACRKLGNEFLFSSKMMMHCDNLWVLEKLTHQYAALSFVDRAFKLAISEDNASEDMDDN